MNTQDENMEVAHTSDYDPFPIPQTIPSGWDLSELLSAPKPFDLAPPAGTSQGRPASVTEADDTAES